MDWRQIVKTILTDVKELKLAVEIELVLGNGSKGIVAIKIKTQAQLGGE